MGITTVTRNFQVTLPSDVRETENIKIGDRLVFAAESGSIIVKKLGKEGVAERTFGIWKEVPGPEYVRKIREDAEKRLKRLGV